MDKLNIMKNDLKGGKKNNLNEIKLKFNKKKSNKKNCNSFILNNKKAFAFSFLALFLSFLLFAFAGLYLFKGDYSKNNAYTDSRISFLNNELIYFKKVYIKNTLSFSFYNVINLILENKTLIKNLNQNYTKFNSLVHEGVTNGSFGGIHQIKLENKTLKYFVKIFHDSFYSNYLGNFSFNITKLNIYQKDTYSLSLQTTGVYNITTLDNISSWNYKNTIYVTIPLYNLKDPQYFLEENYSTNIRAVNLYGSSLNWSISLFNETIINNYASIYVVPSMKYSIGGNFIGKLLNISKSSYDKVLGFYSFDYDEENRNGLVMDTSLNSPFIKDYGNTRLLFDFDNKSINSNIIKDLSGYNNNGVLYNGVNCSISGIFNEGCKFDGVNDYINISKEKLNLNNTNQITISAWIKPKSYGDMGGGIQTGEIFRYGGSFPDVLDLRILQSGKIQMEIGSHNGGNYKFFNSLSIIKLNTWSYVTGTFNGDTGIGKIYINSRLDFEDNTSTIINFLKSYVDIGIGNYLNSFNERFNGSIDELSIYSKTLSSDEIIYLYKQKKAELIDYKNSLHGKAIEFDGKDDYISLDNLTNANPIYDDQIKQRSGEFWFKTYNKTKSQIIYEEGGPDNGINLYINNSKIYFGAYSKSLGWNGLWLSYPIEENRWNYVTYVFNSNLGKKIMALYINSKLKNYSNSNLITKISGGHSDDDAIGKISTSALLNGNINLGDTSYFQGLIDEVKIYNKTLTNQEILDNYLNYDSFSKGCCNYLELVNPNKFNYNSSLYKNNISYSNKVFYDYYKNGGNLNLKKYNITVYNITNITSSNINNNFYKFKIDSCMLQAYSISAWINSNFVHFGADNASCINLIKKGIY